MLWFLIGVVTGVVLRSFITPGELVDRARRMIDRLRGK